MAHLSVAVPFGMRGAEKAEEAEIQSRLSV
jgi:hypothetical protein